MMMRTIFLRTGLILIFLIIYSESKAQLIKSRLDFVGGISYPEYLHGGIRYQYAENLQLGIFYGGDMELNPEIIRTWSFNNMYHFGKHNFFSNRPVWYTRQGFTYSLQTDEAYTYKHSYITLSGGYEFPLNNWIGINFDMGFNIKVYETTVYTDTNEEAFNPDPSWYPGFLARLQIYVSL